MTENINHRDLFFKPGISASSINDFYQSPARFWLHSSYNPERIKKDQTPAMLFGRLVHCLVLTPDAFDTEFACEPAHSKDDLDTVDQLKEFILARAPSDQKIPSKAKKQDLINIIKANWPDAPIWQDKLDQFMATLGKRQAVTVDQFSSASQMRDAMFKNSCVRNLIGNGMSESPFCWWPEGTSESTENGLMKKCRLDYVRSGLVIEYKTTVDPKSEEFAKSIGNMGYHRQLAMQVEAAERMYGERPRGAIIIAQDKEVHDDIAIYALDAQDIQIGFEENEYAYQEIKRRLSAHDWRSYTEDIQPIKLPRWYQPKHIARV